MGPNDYHPLITDAALREHGFRIYKTTRPGCNALYCLVEGTRFYQVDVYCYHLNDGRHVSAEAHFYRPGTTFHVVHQIEPSTTLDELQLFFQAVYIKLDCEPYPGLQ
jgi:hypothetical protein